MYLFPYDAMRETSCEFGTSQGNDGFDHPRQDVDLAGGEGVYRVVGEGGKTRKPGTGRTPGVLRKNPLLTTCASPAYPALSAMMRCRFYGPTVDKTGHPIPCHKMPKILGTSRPM